LAGKVIAEGDFLEKRYIIRPAGHAIATLAISGLVYLTFRSTTAFFASLFAGILIDVDHILDYYLQRGVTLKIRKIYFWCAEKQFDFIFLFFHSFELVFLLWSIISLFRLGIFWFAFAIGITQHMVLDILFNRSLNVYCYFLSFRIVKKFRKGNILK